MPFTVKLLAVFEPKNEVYFSEESLKNQFREIEERVKREGSYIYVHDYQYSNQVSLNDGLGSGDDSNDSILV